MERGLVSLAIGFEYVLIYSKSSDASINPIFRQASEERQTTGYWKGFWNAPDRPTMRYPLLGVTPKTGQWKWKKEIGYEAVANYEEYLKKHSKKKTLEEYWEETGKTKKFIRRNPDGKGMNNGVEHWIPPSEGILRTSNWTDQLASESLSNLNLPFDNPKHRELLAKLVQFICEEEDIALDFFAGSCTSAHAVMALNAEDGGNRKFICVQLAEPCEQETKALKAGFKTIADIGKERIRRAAKKIKEENKGKLDFDGKKLDLGFKVFRLEESNFKQWRTDIKTAEELEKRLSLFVDNVKSESTQENILYELIVKTGLDLNVKVVAKKANGKQYFVIEQGKLIICLEEKITKGLADKIISQKPEKCICLDRAFKNDDQLKTNTALQMEAEKVEFKVI